MTGFDAYKEYMALNLHFKDPKYSYFKYNGKVAAKLTTYKASPQFSVFERLANKYSLIFPNLVLANIIEKKHIRWAGELFEDESQDNYLLWKKRVDGLSYLFSEDCSVIRELLDSRDKQIQNLFEVPKGGYPPIVELYLQQMVSLETLSVIEGKTLFCSRINKYLKNDFIWEDLSLRIQKYWPFLLMRIDEKKIRKTIREKLL